MNARARSFTVLLSVALATTAFAQQPERIDAEFGIVALIVNVVVFAFVTLVTRGRLASQPAGSTVPVPATGAER